MKIAIILRSLLVVGVMASVLVYGTKAFFSDKEESKDNAFAAGELNLKIDNTCYYNFLKCEDGKWQNTGDKPLDVTLNELVGVECKTSWTLTDLGDENLFFDFRDVKPGDWGEDTISFHVVDNDSWVCMDVDVTGTPENGRTEPEALIDQSDDQGELQDNLKFVFWADDGDNVLETNEKPFIQNKMLTDIDIIALADSKNNVWGEKGPFPGGDLEDESMTKYIGKAWCFGELTLEPVEQSENNSPTLNPGILCNGSLLDNSTQTDQVMADVKFSAVQSRNNMDFTCITCKEPGEAHAVQSLGASQGLRKNGTAVSASRSDPSSTLGAADGTTGGGSPIEGKFYSLGFGGEITLKLASFLTGNIITIREITGGRNTYPEEKAELWVSEDNVNWVLAGIASSKGTDGYSTVDVSGTGLDQIMYIKVVDVSEKSIFESTADGYDIDAIDAELCLDNID